jgi:hypothetical protein
MPSKDTFVGDSPYIELAGPTCRGGQQRDAILGWKKMCSATAGHDGCVKLGWIMLDIMDLIHFESVFLCSSNGLKKPPNGFFMVII